MHVALASRKALLHEVPLPLFLASAVDYDDVVVAADEVRAVTNRDGGLELVCSEDPKLDVGLLQVSDRLGDAVLQTILNSGRTEQTEIMLNVV